MKAVELVNVLKCRLFAVDKFVRRHRAANRMSGYTSTSRPIVIGGCGRSGTTLLRVMLDSHQHICCGPESRLFTPEPLDIERLARDFDMEPREVAEMQHKAKSRAEFIEMFFGNYCRITGKPRWAEKTPNNILYLDFIFQAFPQLSFLHVIRDGRDVACSLRTHPRYKVENGQLIPLNTWRPIEECVERWVTAIQASRKYASDPRYLEVRYEDLVLDSRATMEKVLAFVGEPWDEQALRHAEVHTGSRDVTKFPQNPEAVKPLYQDALGRWKQHMSDEDKAIFKRLGGNLLIELGYASSNDW